MKKIFITLGLLSSIIASAQVLIDDTKGQEQMPNANSILELKSANKGLILPRMDSAPTEMEVPGMIYFNTSSNSFMGYTGNEWVSLQPSTSSVSTNQYVLSINDFSGEEGLPQEFEVKVSPSIKSGDQVTVGFSTLGDSAEEGVDYVAQNSKLTFDEGEESKTITISTIDDDLSENDETYMVMLSNAVASGNAEVTIQDDDGFGTIVDNDSNSETNLIANGGFESWSQNIPEGWDTINDGIELSEETGITNEGNSAARVNLITKDQKKADLRQSVTVEEGKNYKVSVDVYQLNSDVRARLYVGGFKKYSESEKINQWQTIEGDYEATSSGSVEMGLRFYDDNNFSGNAEIIIDNFRIIEIQ